MKIIKEELRFEENLKKRLEFICEFSKGTSTFFNGSIRKIEKTNISYIEPHRVITLFRWISLQLLFEPFLVSHKHI